MAIPDIRKPLKKYLPHLLKAAEDNLNEADTVQRLFKVFEDVLGYDAMSEISREAAIKDRYVDVALKIDGTVRLLVEAKSAGTTLRAKHIEQAQNYAANSNIRWVLLTNSVDWHLYHLSFEEGIEASLAFMVSLAEGVTDKGAELLALLHRQSIKKGDLDAYWETRVALAPGSIARALFHEDTLRLIRREIRRREGILPDEEDLARAIHEMLSTEARERIGPLKVKRRPKAKASSGPKESADAALAPEPCDSGPIPEEAGTESDAADGAGPEDE
jgi:predicted type IV restriction endonuclease